MTATTAITSQRIAVDMLATGPPPELLAFRARVRELWNVVLLHGLLTIRYY